MVSQAEVKRRVGVLSVLDSPMLGYLLRALIDQKITIGAVILDSKPVSEKGRRIFEERTRGALPPIPLWEFEQAEIPCFFVRHYNAPETQRLVKSLSLDLLLNGGSPRMLKPGLLEAPRLGVLNCHPGLLPDFRGCTCVEWAVYLDEPVGNAVHFMDEEIDHGPVVMSETVPICRTDDYVGVRTKVYRHNVDLLARGARKVLEEGLTPRDLPAQGQGRYFKVIEPDKMDVVIRRLAEGQYKLQREAHGRI